MNAIHLRLRVLLLAALAWPAPAAEGPFFITYTHQMEEPGNLEIATREVMGKPEGGNRFFGITNELEYGVQAWWTTELYLEGQATSHDGALFTGYRWENRFRLLPHEHWINPVLYVEFENINDANRSLLEVVGHDGQDGLASPIAIAGREKKRELEAKLILGSNVRGWNISENFIAEKNVRHAPFEFGYAVGVSRPLALAARPEPCNICPENFQAGLELYGGLGTHDGFGLRQTSHYLAPTMAWQTASGATFKVSPGFGITGQSAGFLLRVAVSYEISQFARALRKQPKQAVRPNPYDDLERDDKAGQKLFRRECASCHGEDAQGMGHAPAPASASPGEILRVLRDGSMRRGMPSFSHLPEQQRRQILSWLKTLDSSATTPHR